jgi:GT2 family glycosyltransferase
MSEKILKVSIVILNYNGRRFLKNLFNSLLNQTFKKFEIIFVDNGSNDGSILLLRNLLKKRPYSKLRVKIVLNESNLGYCKGNNEGLKYAVGEYVVFLNNDTDVSPTWLDELVKVMGSSGSIGVCQSRLLSAQTKEIQSDGWMLDEFGGTKAITLSRFESAPSAFPFYASGTSLIVRRDILQVVGGYDPFLFSGDFDLCWRIRLLGYNVATAPKSVCYHYGQVATRTLFNSTELRFSSDKEFMRVFIKNFSRNTILPRLCTLVFRMIAVSMYLSFKENNPICFLSPLEAILWNLRKLRDTLSARRRIEKHRKVPRQEVERNILRGSVDVLRRLGYYRYSHR